MVESAKAAMERYMARMEGESGALYRLIEAKIKVDFGVDEGFVMEGEWDDERYRYRLRFQSGVDMMVRMEDGEPTFFMQGYVGTYTRVVDAEDVWRVLADLAEGGE